MTVEAPGLDSGVIERLRVAVAGVLAQQKATVELAEAGQLSTLEAGEYVIKATDLLGLCVQCGKPFCNHVQPARGTVR